MSVNRHLLSGIIILSTTLYSYGQKPNKLAGKWREVKIEREDGYQFDAAGFPLQAGLIYEFKDGYAFDYSFGQFNSKKPYIIVGDTLKIGTSFISTIVKLNKTELILLDTVINTGFEGKRLKYYFKRSDE